MIAPKIVYFPSLTGITLYIEIVHHSNYKSTSTSSIIWFSEIFIFSKIDKIFSCKIALEIFDRRATIRGNTVLPQVVNCMILRIVVLDFPSIAYEATYLGLWTFFTVSVATSNMCSLHIVDRMVFKSIVQFICCCTLLMAATNKSSFSNIITYTMNSR